MNTVVINTISMGLTRALTTNSVAPDWQTMLPIATTGATDGLWSASADQASVIAPNRLFIMPFASGQPLSQFCMRVWGWRDVTGVCGDGPRQLSLPYLIAEFLFTTCNAPGPQSEGPPGTASLRTLKSTENLCDTAVLTRGDLGQGGWINMTGVAGTPTDLPGYVLIDLQGSRKFQFDFKQVDAVEMNAFFAKA